MTQIVPTTSEAILAALMSEATGDRRRETLTRLKEACDGVAARGASMGLRDLQKAVEERHGKEAGPKAQSISNERKRPLGMYHYVEARERERVGQIPGKEQRRGRGNDAVSDLIGTIKDVDVRSAMYDLLDRAVLAEKAIKRAKVLFKHLRPGADMDQLLGGQPEVISTSSGSDIDRDQIQALVRLLGILTDDANLSAVGLSYDGRRVRRKAGTRDELIDADTLKKCELLSQRIGRNCP